MAETTLQQSGGTLRSSLEEFVRKLAKLEEGWLERQRQVAEELVKREERAIQGLTNTFGQHKVFRIVREFWHRRLRTHLNPESPGEAVLCAFGEVADNVVKEAGIGAFLQWAATQPGFNPQVAADTAGPQVAKRATNLNEAAAALGYCHGNPGDNKVNVDTPQLRGDMEQAINYLRQQNLVQTCLGGAPAIIADVLSQLGLSRVHLYAMYHSDRMARLSVGQPLRVDPNTSPTQSVCVNQPGQYSVGGMAHLHPTRSSHIFTYGQSHQFSLGNSVFTATRDDRVIFRVYRYIGNHQGHWQQAQVKLLVNGQPTPWLPYPGMADDEWPFLPAFVRWEVRNNTLSIECLDENGVVEIRDHDYIILNAPGLGTSQPADALSLMEAESLQQQLGWLAKGPARIHLEISGVDPSRNLIGPFSRSVRGVIHSVGLGADELPLVTILRDWAPPVLVTAGASSVYQRYEQALRLAEELSLDRLYVHGHDVDMVLRRNGSPGDMRGEVCSDLFAKGIVVLAVLQRTTGDVLGYLEADYAIAIAEAGLTRARGMVQRGIQPPNGAAALAAVEQSVSDAKSALRTGLFHDAEREAKAGTDQLKKAFGIRGRPGSASTSLTPVLPVKSFVALIEFAYDFVRFALGMGDARRMSGLTEEGEKTFQWIVETGYHADRSPDNYSVAVVPVLWPELPIRLNPTGAGDICSGVTAVFSGF